MLISGFIILFWVSTGIGLHALMLKETISFLIPPSAAAVRKHSVSAPVSLSPAHLIGQLAHA